MAESQKRVAALLNRLADGESVTLGEFSGQADPQASDADVDADTLRTVADGLVA